MTWVITAIIGSRICVRWLIIVHNVVDTSAFYSKFQYSFKHDVPLYLFEPYPQYLDLTIIIATRLF